MSGTKTFFDASVLVAAAWTEAREHPAALVALEAADKQAFIGEQLGVKAVTR
jgi:predicted nucleic acid-binding protein